MEEKYFIRRFTKVFSEGIDKYWWFDIEKFLKLASPYDFDSKELRRLIELAEEDENKKIASDKTIGRVLGYFNGEKEGGGNKSVSINTIKSLGKALCEGDEYGLLIKIEPSNVLKAMKQAELLWGASDLNRVYRKLNDMLYEFESSSYYFYKPGTKEEGFEFYDMRLQEVRNEVDTFFWNKSEIRNKLYKLIEEVELLIKSNYHPSAPERWMQANPNLKYYDCVFDIVKENFGLYESIKKGQYKTAAGKTISFKFYPTKKECAERDAYFDELERKNNEFNSHYSLERFYQRELVEAFRAIFESDFKNPL